MRLTLVHCLLSLNSSPHLGLLSLAAYVKQNLNWVNLTVVESLDPVGEIIKSRPDVLGFTADTIAFNRTVEVAKIISKKLHNTRMIIGGVHITACPESFNLPFDVGVVGEGELTLVELLKLFSQKKSYTKTDLKKIQGLVFLVKNKVELTPRREFIKDLDSLPFPARDLIDMEEMYLKKQINLFGVKRMVTVMTSRGCPYHCVYCGSPVQWGMVRFHSAEYVIEEIRHLIETYKVDGITFPDDLFICPKPRLLKLVELIKDEGWHTKIVFSGFARANLMDEEICLALKSINVRKLTFGFESYNKKILDYLKDRSVTVKQNILTIKMCHKYGIAVASGLIVGTPGEGMKELMDTYNTMKKYPMDNSQIYVLTPYPGTKIWNLAEREGLVSLDMNMEKLFVQIPLSASLRFWKKDKFSFLNDRVFINTKMRNNQKYLEVILKMNLLAFWQNFIYYVKALKDDPLLFYRLLISW